MKSFLKISAAVIVLLLVIFIGRIIYNGTDFFSNTIHSTQTTLQEEPTFEHLKIVHYEPDDEHVKPLGRTIFSHGIRWLSMSGSGAEFECSASSVKITLISENAGRITYSHRPRVAVYVNGETQFDEALSQQEQTVTIDLTKYGANAVVRIVKLSEAMCSDMGIGEIELLGKKEIKPTEQKDIKIEFVGDSITTGFGIDEQSSTAAFSCQTQNFSKTYAYLTAAALDADYSAVAFSGYGVLSGYTSDGRRKEDATIYKNYSKVLMNTEIEYSDFWNSTKFVPDYVVVNLGHNDASYCTTEDRREAFVKEYKTFLSLIRSKNPSAYILCILGDMNNSMYPYIERAAKEFRDETGDKNVSAASINFNMREAGSVIKGHPGEQANIYAAENLTQRLREIMQAQTNGDLESLYAAVSETEIEASQTQSDELI